MSFGASKSANFGLKYILKLSATSAYHATCIELKLIAQHKFLEIWKLLEVFTCVFVFVRLCGIFICVCICSFNWYNYLCSNPYIYFFRAVAKLVWLLVLFVFIHSCNTFYSHNLHTSKYFRIWEEKRVSETEKKCKLIVLCCCLCFLAADFFIQPSFFSLSLSWFWFWLMFIILVIVQLLFFSFFLRFVSAAVFLHI